MKECSNCRTIALISHASKVMLKILQARLRQYMNCELPDVQAGFRKGRGSRDQIANIRWIIKKTREFQNDICFPGGLDGKEYACNTGDLEKVSFHSNPKEVQCQRMLKLPQNCSYLTH